MAFKERAAKKSAEEPPEIEPKIDPEHMELETVTESTTRLSEEYRREKAEALEAEIAELKQTRDNPELGLSKKSRTEFDKKIKAREKELEAAYSSLGGKEFDAERRMTDEEILAEQKHERKEAMAKRVDEALAKEEAGEKKAEEPAIEEVLTEELGEREYIMEKNELPPKLKAYHEQEVKRLGDLAHELEEGWKTLEKELQKDGVDLDKLAVSKWGQFKVGLRKLLSPNFRAKMNEYDEKLAAWKQASTDLENSRSWLKKPKETYLAFEAQSARRR